MFERIQDVETVAGMGVAIPMLMITIMVLIGFTSIRLIKIVFGKD